MHRTARIRTSFAEQSASSCINWFLPLALAQVELKSGEMYRGELQSAEDNWNMTVRNVLATAKDGRQSNLDTIFLRGSRIRFVTVPEMLKHAPMFKRIDPKYSKKGFGAGVGNVSV